jgi:hypothetical protein
MSSGHYEHLNTARVFKLWTTHVDKRAEHLRQQLAVPPRREIFRTLAHEWLSLREYQKMNLLIELSSGLCKAFSLADVRLFSKKSWKSYKSASRYEDPSQYERANYACNIAEEGGRYIPTVIFYTDNDYLNEKGFLDAVGTIGHEVGHYCLDVYIRRLAAQRSQDHGKMNVSGYFTGESKDIDRLGKYIDAYKFYYNDDAHYAKQIALTRKMDDARAKSNREQFKKLHGEYFRAPDEQGAEYVAEIFENVVKESLSLE